MSQLFYRFDARKLVVQTDYVSNSTLFASNEAARTAVINEFKAIMGNANNRVFETIWNSNPALRQSLFPTLSPTQVQAGRNAFQALVNDSESILYQFIKIQ